MSQEEGEVFRSCLTVTECFRDRHKLNGLYEDVEATCAADESSSFKRIISCKNTHCVWECVRVCVSVCVCCHLSLTFSLQPLSFWKCVSILTWNLGRKEHFWKEQRREREKHEKEREWGDYVEPRANCMSLSWHMRILTVYSIVKHQWMEKKRGMQKRNWVLGHSWLHWKDYTDVHRCDDTLIFKHWCIYCN